MDDVIKRKRKTHINRKNEPDLPARFTPKFWQDADTRFAIIREVRGRVDRLKEEAGADSYQREIIAERAAFLCCWLETQERIAIEDGNFDPGPYAQATNTLLGLLRSLGLERARQKAIDLKTYVAKKQKKGSA